MNSVSERGRVTVLGAGVIGVTSAYLLARAGYLVTVVERENAAGKGTSAENGAQLSYGFADPISGPATLRRVPAIVAGRDPGISVNPGQFLANPGWSLAFLRNCLGGRARENSAALTRLALYSRTVTEQIREDTGIEFSFTRSGRLVLYSNQRVLDASREGVEFRNSLGCELEVLSRDECLAVDDALAHWQAPIAGGVYSRTDEAGDAAAWCRELARYSAEQLGVVFHYSCEVTGFVRRGGGVAAVRTSKGELPVQRLVICLGPQSRVLRKTLGLRLPVVPLKGYSLTLPANDRSPRVSIASAEHRIVFARLGECVRFAGLAHLRGADLTLDPSHVAEVLEGARRLLPDAGKYDAPLSSWCGLRPLTPDGLPRIGETKLRDVYVNTGHGGLGWTLAAGSAALLISMLNGETEGGFSRRSALGAFRNPAGHSGVAIA